MHSGNNTNFMLGIAVSLVIHAMGFGYMYFFAGKSQARSNKKVEFISAVFVRKGKPRPKHLLPRIHATKRTAPVRRRVVIQRQAPPKRRRRRRRRKSVDDIIKAAQRRIQAYKNSMKKDDPRADNSAPAGVADGHDDGTVSTRAQARLGSTYGRLLRRKIERRFRAPRIFTQTQINQYKSRIEVEMRIDRSGRLLRVRVVKSSGNLRFDNALATAIRNAAPYPSPPNQIWRAVRAGITISF